MSKAAELAIKELAKELNIPEDELRKKFSYLIEPKKDDGLMHAMQEWQVYTTKAQFKKFIKANLC